MKAIHVLTVIFAALLLHSITKDYVNRFSSGNRISYSPRIPYPPANYPLTAYTSPPRSTQGPREHAPDHRETDPFPTTLPVDIRQSVPQPVEIDVGASWVDAPHQDYAETILDSPDQYKDVISHS